MTPHNKGKGAISATCVKCNSIFFHHKWEGKSGKYCSAICYHQHKIGEIHQRWTNKPAYTTIHNWVRNHFLASMECEKCHKICKSGRSIHWSNISRKYKRERSDWQRLCVSCHKKYDLANIKNV